MASIRKIPNELLGEIFLYAFPGSIDFTSKELLYRFRLRQVCREWQSVALGEALLWNDVYVLLYGRLETRNMKMLERANACLRLSRNSPVTIRILHYFAPEPDINTHAISDIIIPYTKRIVDLQLFTKFPMFKPLLLLPSGSFPSLQRLTMQFFPANEGHVDASLLPEEVHAFRDAPALTSVEICLPRSLTALGIPLSQLHQLSLKSAAHNSMQPVIDDLKTCVNLRACTLSINSYYEDTGLPCATFAEMPYLKKLELCGGPLGRGHCKSVPLAAPGLEELAVLSVRWPPAILTSFITRSQCMILRLRLKEVSNTFLDEFLGSLPFLEELDVEMMALTSSTMQKMSLGTFCPALRSLKSTVQGRMFGEFLDMLISRAQMRGTTPPSRIVDVKIFLLSLEVARSLAIEWLEGQGIRIRQLHSKWTFPALGDKKEVFNDELDFTPPT